MTSQVKECAEKLLFDASGFLMLLKEAAAYRIDSYQPDHIGKTFQLARFVYEKCVLAEKLDKERLMQQNTRTVTLEHVINDKLTIVNAQLVFLPCRVDFEFLKKGLDRIVEALLMNVTLTPACADEVLRLCTIEPFKSMVTTPMAAWNFSAYYRQCQTAVFRDLEDILKILGGDSAKLNSAQSQGIDNASATKGEPMNVDNNGETTGTDRNGGQPSANKQPGSRSSSPPIPQTVDGLPRLEMQKVVSFMEKVVNWREAAGECGWFNHFQLQGLLKSMNMSKHGKDLLLACLCINRAKIDISKRATLGALQEKMFGHLRNLCNEISSKNPSDRWLWLKELQEELCAKTSEEFPAFERWYTDCIEDCVQYFDKNLYLPTLCSTPIGPCAAAIEFARDVSWRLFYLLQRNTEMRKKVGSILIIGQRQGLNTHPTVWSKIYGRLTSMLNQF